MGKRNLGASALHFCINGSGPSGTISGTALQDTHSFEGLPEMLVLADELLDKIGRPQKSLAEREGFDGTRKTYVSYVGNPKLYHTADEILASFGEAATFDVLFQMRKHGTWQGMVFGADGARLGNFASEIGLIEIILGPEAATGLGVQDGFTIRLHGGENETWQGTVTEDASGRTKAFRSALELAKQMHSAG